MKYRTLHYSIRRIQPLNATIKYLKAIDREFEKLGSRIDAPEVVVVERVVKEERTVDDNVADVLKVIRPDYLGMHSIQEYGRDVMVLVFQAGALAVDITGENTAGSVRKVLREVLAA